MPNKAGDMLGAVTDFVPAGVALQGAAIALVGSIECINISAGNGDIAEIEARHFLVPHSSFAVNPRMFIAFELIVGAKVRRDSSA